MKKQINDRRTHNSQNNKKKTIALLIAATMLAMLAPFSALADDDRWPPEPRGQIVHPQGGLGAEISADANGYVKMQQSIAPAPGEGENVFEVTTTVTTKEELGKLTISPDAAVVLLLDVSNSMGSSDISNLKASAKQFVNDYTTDLTEGAKRLISVVQFGTNAMTLSGWRDVGHTGGAQAESIAAARGAIDSAKNQFTLLNGKDKDSGGTNMSGALQIARNLVASLKGDASHSDITNLYVILFTDGLPTYRVGAAGRDGGSTEYLTYGPSNDRGTGENDPDGLNAAEVRYQAMRLEGLGADIFTIQYKTTQPLLGAKPAGGISDPYAGATGGGSNSQGGGGNSQGGGGNSQGGGGNSQGNGGGGNSQGSGGKTTADSTGIASQSFQASNLAGLTQAFANFNTYIRKYAEAWQVHVPMAALMTNVRVMTENSGHSHYSADQNAINWNLKSDMSFETLADGSDTIYRYRMAYRVTLDTLDPQFRERAGQDGEYPVSLNGGSAGDGTYLNYVLSVGGKTPDDPGDYKTAFFSVPTVEGFKADLGFTKVDSSDRPLGEGFDFSLTNGSYGRTASTGADGAVAFTAVPSGHEYTLRETGMSDELAALYELNGTPLTVAVSYGQAAIYAGGAYVTSGYRFVNSDVYVEPSNPSISVTKGAANEPGGDDGGYLLGERVVYEITIANDGDVHLTGVKWSELPGFDGPYTTEACTTGLDAPQGGLELPAGPGGSLTFYYSRTVTAEDVDRGSIYNVVTATGNGGGEEVRGEDDETVKTSGRPNLTVTKTVHTESANGDNVFDDGATVVFAIEVANTGNATAKNIRLTDNWGYSDAPGRIAGVDVPGVDAEEYAQDFSLAPGAKVTFYFEVTVEGDSLGGIKEQFENDMEAARLAYEAAFRNVQDLLGELGRADEAIAQANADFSRALDEHDGRWRTPGNDGQGSGGDYDGGYGDDYDDDYDDGYGGGSGYAQDNDRQGDDDDQGSRQGGDSQGGGYDGGSQGGNSQGGDYDNQGGDSQGGSLEELRARYLEALGELQAQREAIAAALAEAEAELARVEAAYEALKDMDLSGDILGSVKTYENTATVTYDYDPDGITSDKAVVQVNPKPVTLVAVDKTVSAAGANSWHNFLTLPYEGGHVDYKIEVRNYGNKPVDVTLADVFDGSDYTHMIDGAAAFTLDAFGSQTLHIRGVEIRNGDSHASRTAQNTATIAYMEGADRKTLSDHAHVLVPATPYTELQIAKKASLDGAAWLKELTAEGDEAVQVTYRLTVYNTGTKAAAFTLSDSLYGGPFYTDAACTAEAAEADFALAPGADRDFYYRMDAQPDTATVNVATVTYDGGEDDSTATVIIGPVPKSAVISVSKDVARFDAALQGDYGAYTGWKKSETISSGSGVGQFVFRITLSNTGGAGASIALSDLMNGSSLGSFGGGDIDGTYYVAPGSEIAIYAPVTLSYDAGVPSYNNVAAIRADSSHAAPGLEITIAKDRDEAVAIVAMAATTPPGGGDGGDGWNPPPGPPGTPAPTAPPAPPVIIINTPAPSGEADAPVYNASNDGWVEIFDADVPLGEWEFDEQGEVLIIDPEVPLAEFPASAMPQTGISGNSTLWMIALSMSLIALGSISGLIGISKRRARPSLAWIAKR